MSCPLCPFLFTFICGLCLQAPLALNWYARASLHVHALPRLQDCFAWLHTYNCSGVGVQPVCGVRAKQMVFFTLFFGVNFGPLGYMLEAELLFTWAFMQRLKRSCLPALRRSFDARTRSPHGDNCGSCVVTSASAKWNRSIKKSHNLICFCLQILSSRWNVFRHRRRSAVILNSFVFANWRHPRCDLQHNFAAKCRHLHSLQRGLPNELRRVFQVGSH